MEKVTGRVCYHNKTKQLVKQIQPDDIAVISHEGIDATAADSLITKKVKAVINLKRSMTGALIQDGVRRLLKQKIHVYDAPAAELGYWMNKRYVEIQDNMLFLQYAGKLINLGALCPYNEDIVQHLNEQAEAQRLETFEQFCGNSLEYAGRDIGSLLQQWEDWQEGTSLVGQDACIVIRGADYVQDLEYAKKYILPRTLCWIAVDGAADEMINNDIIPDYIIGDMDSVSRSSLSSGARLIVHQGQSGYAPGFDRVHQYNLRAETVTFIGLSEDAATAFALKEGAENIFFIGGHRDMDEYLSKGRKGMGSSLLMRMFAGSRLIDLKGIHRVQKHTKMFPTSRWKYKIETLLAEKGGRDA